MATIRKKIVKLPDGLEINELNILFDQITGKDYDLNIIFNKMEKLKSVYIRSYNLFDKLVNSNIYKITKNNDDIEIFMNNIKNELDTLYLFENNNSVINYMNIENHKTYVSENYKIAKDSLIIKEFIKTYDNLIPYKNNITNVANLSYNFIDEMVGYNFMPLSFSCFNFKINTEEQNAKIFLLTILYKIYEFSHEIYSINSAPDTDIDKLIDILMSGLDSIENLPELSRCKNAFNKLRNSVDLLKGNFSQYYKDFQETNDPTIIMQNYILDVTKQNSKQNAVLMREFNIILRYYKNKQKEHPKMNNPIINKFTQKADQVINMMNKNE